MQMYVRKLQSQFISLPMDLHAFLPTAPPTSSQARFSATIDRQQLEVCYRELHATRVVVHNRLDLNFDPKTVGDSLRKVHALLKPYREELST